MPIEYNPFDDARLAKIRAEQDDPIIQYYIVRKDVSMSVGKACAQVAHGAQIFATTYLKGKFQGIISEDKIDLVEEWFNGSFRKVVLGGTEKDFEKIKKELDVFVVRDAGLTEVESGTETVLVLWPIRKSQQPKVLQRLRVLSTLHQGI